MATKTKTQGITVGYDGKRAVQNMTGLGNYSRLVAGTMAAMYPDNNYVLLAPRMRENPRLERLLMRENVKTATPQGAFSRRLPAWWRSVEMVHDWQRLGLDIYHGLSNELPLTSRLGGIPTVVTIHDLIWRRVPQDYSAVDRRIYELKYRRSARDATRIIAISERTKADIVADWHLDPMRIDVIYQGCDPVFALPVDTERRMGVRARYNLPRRYIIAVGTVQSRKNQLLAVRALEGLPADVALVIVGGEEAAYGRRLDAEAARLGLADRVIRLRNVPFDDLPALYAGAEFSSYTSRYEGFGLPVIESLSAGTPVVACTGSCLEEAGGPGAVYVAPDDVNAYVDAARAMLEKRYYRDRLAENGRRYIRRFNRADFASSILKTYNKAIVEFYGTGK